MRYLFSVLIVTVLAVPAEASLQIVPFTVAPNANEVLETSIPTNNDFRNDIAAAMGSTANAVQVVSGDVMFTQNGTVAFFVHAAESGYNNSFSATGITTYQEGNPIDSNPPGNVTFGFGSPFSPIALGTVNVTAGQTLSSLAAMFSSAETAMSFGPNTQEFGIFRDGNTNTGYSRLFLGYDDNGAGPDDNHDDLIVSVYFIPEPATIAVWSVLGLIGITASRRLVT